MNEETGRLTGQRFDWSEFWAFTGKQKLFNSVLYRFHYRQYLKLLKGVPLKNISYLELGAGTGIIPQRLIRRTGGHCVLVDNNELAYQLFMAQKQKDVEVDYLRLDIFDLNLDRKFDVVCSDGLIEHFPDKIEVFELHRRFLKPDGYIIIFVPKDTWFIRFLQNHGPTFGYEEWYSLENLITLCQAQGLEVVSSVDYFFEVGVLCQIKNNPQLDIPVH